MPRPSILHRKMELPQAIRMISLREIWKLEQFPAGGSLTLPYIGNRILLAKLQFEYLYLMVSSFSSKDKPEIDTGTEIVYNDEKM